jgi:predicted ribosomally synthesized peptide with SipW-like signal peptide
MKSIFLSVVIICALAISGIGGTLATWSDSEISENNTIVTGSLDLKVNGADDLPWGTGVPTKVEIDCMIPCKFYGPYEVELWNAGQCEFPSHAYLDLKWYECSNVEPKWHTDESAYWPPNSSTGYPDPETGELKPEPELVAEHGGKVDCHWVPGIGREGDECSMGSHVELIVTADRLPPNDPDADIIRRDKLFKWRDDGEVYLFDLMPCEPRMIFLWFHLQQDPEELYGYNIIPNPGDPGYDELHWKKFNDWPSWALMKDKVEFSIEFDLWLEDTPGGVVPPDGC